VLKEYETASASSLNWEERSAFSLERIKVVQKHALNSRMETTLQDPGDLGENRGWDEVGSAVITERFETYVVRPVPRFEQGNSAGVSRVITRAANARAYTPSPRGRDGNFPWPVPPFPDFLRPALEGYSRMRAAKRLPHGGGSRDPCTPIVQAILRPQAEGVAVTVMRSLIDEFRRGGGSQKRVPGAAVHPALQFVRGDAGTRLGILRAIPRMSCSLASP
jgi:hypothetical protein